ncbi:MAG: hypothetical protein A2675_00825 [Candidatus Yonathbacteria bacterium RIFCSPHIGHO2_01_FULL_51_10]|uniref:Uncharacterized protein n=1 Tax=Candidatus Yonathbacteria bacterium RIFCSPHIGHO2_01_FULL_51_10 TaxID=1802723 RepID=A0A1G2S7N7_9BACT|nr:MAG: hypothetical protein A2675_00825 [Candidatus Yonathbacteria bacterium RIFCSPHIGHO2_01_FULL_51_10]
MTIIIDADAATLAGLQIDLLQKIRAGHITPAHLAWFNGLTKKARDELALTKVAQAIKNILEFVGTVVISATGTFVAREKFVVDTSREAKVKIRSLGPNFKNWFLAGEGVVEDQIGEQVLGIARLRKPSADTPIIAELGGRELATTGLTQVYSYMEQQKAEGVFYVPQAVIKLEGNRFSYTNKAGETITEEVANPEHLFEMNGKWYVLRAVNVYWYDVGWNVDASSVEDPRAWGDVNRVFSRNSVLESSATVSAQV